MRTYRASSGPGRPFHEENVDRRKDILAAALRLFAKDGVAATSSAAIAHAAGVTPAMISYYFKNKAGLVDCVAKECLSPCINHVWADVKPAELSSPPLLIRGLVDRIFEVVENMPELPDIWNREIFNAGGMLRRKVMELIPTARIQEIVAAIHCAQNEKAIVNAGLAPDLLPVTVMGIILLPLAGREILDHVFGVSVINKQALRRHALAILLYGISPLPSGSDQQTI